MATGTKGNIHSVETFGTTDGPGIRFVVFLQGCPLRCKFCHNRDTWEPGVGREVTVPELLTEIQSYLDIYKNSGGGVTASGGEPTLQIDFVRELFGEIKKLGLNTALDTSGFTPPEKFMTLFDNTDIWLFDIKVMDPQKHKWLTGVENETILNNIKSLDEKNEPIWIRYVLIPEINDSDEDLQALCRFAGKLRNVQKVEILPYHTMGVCKWEKLGKEYPLEGIEPPPPAEVAEVRDYLRECGLRVD